MTTRTKRRGAFTLLSLLAAGAGCSGGTDQPTTSDGGASSAAAAPADARPPSDTTGCCFDVYGQEARYSCVSEDACHALTSQIMGCVQSCDLQSLTCPPGCVKNAKVDPQQCAPMTRPCATPQPQNDAGSAAGSPCRRGACQGNLECYAISDGFSCNYAVGQCFDVLHDSCLGAPCRDIADCPVDEHCDFDRHVCTQD